MQSPMPRPSAFLGIALVLSIVLGCDSVGPGNEIANSSSDAKHDVVTPSVKGFPSAQSPQAPVKVIAKIPSNLEHILSADDVKAALGRKDIRSIRMSPIARGYWRHQFDVGNNAPFRMFIFENERMKPPEEEGWDHNIRKIKGHAQQLRWSQRKSASNAKTIGARTAADGEFVFSTTVNASKDETSHE